MKEPEMMDFYNAVKKWYDINTTAYALEMAGIYYLSWSTGSIAWWFLKGKYAYYRTRRDAWNLGYTAWQNIDNTWAQAIGAGRDYVYTKRIWHVWGCNLPIYPSRPKFLEPDVEALFYLPVCPGGGYYNSNGYYQTITVHVPVARKNDGLISPNLGVWKKGQNQNDLVTNFYYGDAGADGGYNHSELRRARRAYTLPGVFQKGEETLPWTEAKRFMDTQYGQ